MTKEYEELKKYMAIVRKVFLTSPVEDFESLVDLQGYLIEVNWDKLTDEEQKEMMEPNKEAA